MRLAQAPEIQVNACDNFLPVLEIREKEVDSMCQGCSGVSVKGDIVRVGA